MEITGSLGSHSLVPALGEVAASGLLRWRLLAQACSGRCPWLGPSPAEVSGLGLLPQQLLPCTKNHLLYRLKARKIFSYVYVIYAKIVKLLTFLPALIIQILARLPKAFKLQLLHGNDGNLEMAFLCYDLTLILSS